MLLHGYTPTDLLKSSIISIPKDAKVSLTNIDNYRGITLLCPGVWGLNEMLKICNKYRLEINIIFNSKKTVCIKFGSTVIEGESAFLTV